ncbi:MAG: bifunctional diaminohydroxyphosphoribosylaminopyrimidine deaminase/5-amino-6-(5-phosphoribosylamino)uracil reductase RibD [Steroidobacteraceae bacterium]
MNAWSEIDAQHMRRALALAALGLDTTDPNPRVGCVLVRHGRVVGEGWHERAGGPHAEARALQAAGEAARGATAYVSLEPCASQGRTPPCTDALMAAAVSRVVYAIGDPNPKMRGGAAVLRAAGIDAAEGLLADEARELNIGFFSRHERGRPWVRVKLGASLDGRTALADGSSQWITSEASRADVQRYRARSSVILTGSTTVLKDDPSLNVRSDAVSRQPLRAVLDTQLRVPPTARMFTLEGPAMAFTASTDEARMSALRHAGVRIEPVPLNGSGLDLVAVLAALMALPANEVWVEAGPRLAGALLTAQLADEIIVYMAPCMLGPQGSPLAQLPPIASLADRLALRYVAVDRIGADLRIIARPAANSGA